MQAEISRFSTQKRKIDHLVASRNRWLEYQGKRVAQQDVNYEGTMAKAPPCPERRMRTPLPRQSSLLHRRRKLGRKVEETKIGESGVSA